jgi:hypothetical protein
MHRITVSVLFCCLAASAVAENEADSGNPEIEAMVSICANASKDKSPDYKRLLKAPFNCGATSTKTPLALRTSDEYRTRFAHASRQMVEEAQGDHHGIRGACEYLALTCVDRTPGWSQNQKSEALRSFVTEKP